MYICSQRIEACYYNVKSEIKFLPLQKERPLYISRNYYMGTSWNLLDVINNLDSSSLARTLWLDNPQVCTTLYTIECGFEHFRILREQERLRDNAEASIAIVTLHFCNINEQHVLPDQLFDVMEAINLLTRLQATIVY